MKVKSSVYLRESTSVESKALKVHYKDEKVKVLSTENGWHKTHDGFIMEGFLK